MRVDAELGERLAAALAVHDDAVEAASSRRQRSSFVAVRRGSRSCAVKTDGARRRSSRSSTCGAASH